MDRVDIRWSPERDKIAAALVAFQAECPNVPKGKRVKVTSKRTGNTHEYAYAPLDKVRDMLRPLLHKQGLGFIQPPSRRTISAIVFHESGQFVEGLLDLPTPESASDPQAWGSLITYFRRYCLLATLGIAAEEEDEDGAYAAEEAREATHLPAPAGGRAAGQRPQERRQAPARPRGDEMPEDWSPGFGKSKGRPLGECSDEELRSLSSYLWGLVDDPKRARFREGNMIDARRVDEVLERRDNQRTANSTGIQGPLDGTAWAKRAGTMLDPEDDGGGSNGWQGDPAFQGDGDPLELDGGQGQRRGRRR